MTTQIASSLCAVDGAEDVFVVPLPPRLKRAHHLYVNTTLTFEPRLTSCRLLGRSEETRLDESTHQCSHMLVANRMCY